MRAARHPIGNFKWSANLDARKAGRQREEETERERERERERQKGSQAGRVHPLELGSWTGRLLF